MYDDDDLGTVACWQSSADRREQAARIASKVAAGARRLNAAALDHVDDVVFARAEALAASLIAASPRPHAVQTCTPPRPPPDHPGSGRGLSVFPGAPARRLRLAGTSSGLGVRL